MNNFQRVGATSNTAVVREFEDAEHAFLARAGFHLQRHLAIPIGHEVTKARGFDFGAKDPPVFVECKSYT